MPGERIEEDCGRVAPWIVKNDVEMPATSFCEKGRRQSLIWLVKGNDRIRAQIRQRLQDTPAASGGNYASSAQVLGDLDGELASDAGRAENQDRLSGLELYAPDERQPRR